MNLKICWTVVYGANLVVPILLASLMVEGKGWIGLSAAVVAFWLAGLCCCARRRIIARSLIIGGVLVGLSQIIPMLHIGIGRVAVETTNRLGHAVNGDPGAFLATLITGGLLLALALILGFLAGLLYQTALVVDEGKPLGKTPLFDPEFEG